MENKNINNNDNQTIIPNNNNKICIKNLPLNINRNEIFNFLKGFGKIKIVMPELKNRIKKQKTTQTAFIKFESRKHYDDALKIKSKKIRGIDIIFEEIRDTEYIPKNKPIELTKDDIKLKEFQVLINKISLDNYNKLEKDILSFIKDEINNNLLIGYSNIIYNTSISQKHFVHMYAQICSKAFSNNSFRSYILNECQSGFSEECIYQDNMTKLEKDDMFSKHKLKLNGNIRFICELYKNALITNNIVSFCTKKLIEIKDYERLYITFNNIGKHIEKNISNFTNYIKDLNVILSDTQCKLESRNKFMIEDILALYKNNWDFVPSCSNVSISNNDNISEIIEPSKIKNIFEEYFENEEIGDLEYNIEQDFGKNKYDDVFINALLIYSSSNKLINIIDLLSKIDDKISIDKIFNYIKINICSIKKDYPKIQNIIDKLNINIENNIILSSPYQSPSKPQSPLPSSSSPKQHVSKKIIVTKSKSKSSYNKNTKNTLVMTNLPSKTHPMDIYTYFNGLGHLEVEIINDTNGTIANVTFTNKSHLNKAFERDGNKIKNNIIYLQYF